LTGYLAAVTQSPITAFVIVMEMTNGTGAMTPRRMRTPRQLLAASSTGAAGELNGRKRRLRKTSMDARCLTGSTGLPSGNLP
jgi:hypothetical protein